MTRQGHARQSELICPFCSKAFHNNKQTTRHIRYCRTKSQDGVSARRKSCASCIKAKARCDIAFPNCSRCVNKSLQCLYVSPNAVSSSDVGGAPAEEIAVAQLADADTPQDGIFEQMFADSGLAHVSARRRSSPSAMGHVFTENGFDYSLYTDRLFSLQWMSGNEYIGGTAFSEGVVGLMPSEPILWNSPSDAFFAPQILHLRDRVILGSYYVFSLSPSSLIPFDTKTVLEKRHVGAGPYGSALSRAYCISTLRSYPGMLCHKDGTLPPFIRIHSRKSPYKANFKSNKDHSVVLPEPLAICSSIMQMYKTRSTENLAFIWRTIQAEAQRIEDERIANKYQPAGWICNGEIQQDQIPTWNEWALAESRRRTTIILIIIIHIFDIQHEPGVPQFGGFAELQLPCGKTFWQASDQATWEEAHRKEYLRGSNSSPSSNRRVLTYRDLLLDLQDLNEPASDLRLGVLSDWFKGMDDLGTLAMMAVSTL